LRRAKKKAHEEFDPLWQEGWMTRNEAYRRLAKVMGIPLKKCHIGMFNIEKCRSVVLVARSLIDVSE
jgi:hypothetical protein